MAVSERCETCHYWRDQLMAQNVGRFGSDIIAKHCKRYPKSRAKMHDDWCGEWRERERDPMDVTQR